MYQMNPPVSTPDVDPLIAQIQAVLAANPKRKAVGPPAPIPGTPMVQMVDSSAPIAQSPEDAVSAFMKANPHPTLKQVGTPIDIPAPPPARTITPRDLRGEGKQAAWTALAGTILGALAGGGAGAIQGGASALGGARSGQDQIDQTRTQEEAQAQQAAQADYANKVALANHAQAEQDKQNALYEKQYGSDVNSWDAQQRIAAMVQAHRDQNQNRDDAHKTAEQVRIDNIRETLSKIVDPTGQRRYHDSFPELVKADGPNWQPVETSKLSPQDAWTKRKEDLQKEAEGLLRRGQDDALPRYNQIMQAISPGAKPLTTLREGMTTAQEAAIKIDKDRAALDREKFNADTAQKNIINEINRIKALNPKGKNTETEKMRVLMAVDKMQNEMRKQRYDLGGSAIPFTDDDIKYNAGKQRYMDYYKSAFPQYFKNMPPPPPAPTPTADDFPLLAPVIAASQARRSNTATVPPPEPVHHSATQPRTDQGQFNGPPKPVKTVPVIPKVATKPVEGVGKKTGVKWKALP